MKKFLMLLLTLMLSLTLCACSDNETNTNDNDEESKETGKSNSDNEKENAEEDKNQKEEEKSTEEVAICEVPDLGKMQIVADNNKIKTIVMESRATAEEMELESFAELTEDEKEQLIAIFEDSFGVEDTGVDFDIEITNRELIMTITVDVEKVSSDTLENLELNDIDSAENKGLKELIEELEKEGATCR